MRRALLILLLAALAAVRGAAQAPSTETLVFAPVADTYVESTSPTKNFNADTQLLADASPIRIAYLRFAVSGVSGRTVQSARLRLGCVNASASGGTVHRISNGSWDETTVTYNTRPAVDGPGIATLGTVAVGQVVEFNLDGTVTGDGVYNLAIDTTNTSAAGYGSMAATSGQRPLLVLTVSGGPTPTVTIDQPADGGTFFVGDTVTLTGTATDPVDGDLSSALTWSSSLQGSLGTGATITAQLAQGTHTVTASVTDADGFTGSDWIAVTVKPPPGPNTEPLVAISAPANGRGFTTGVPVAFTGSANDLEDGDLTARLAWSSDRDGALGTGGSFAKVLSAGTHVITARATDSAGLVGMASVTVTVTAPVVVEFPATADAYVDAGSATTKLGTNALLWVDASPERIAYLRFVVSGVGAQGVAKAVFRLQADSTSTAASNVGGIVHPISNTSWVESAVTYNTRPAVDGPAIRTAGAIVSGQVVDFDLTGAITGDGTYNLALVTTSKDEAIYRSREGGAPPKLVLTLVGNPPAVTITAPASGAVFFQGAPIELRATATDVEDGDLGSRVSWTSSLDGPLGTGATLSTASLRLGTHTVTAAVTDRDGHDGRAQITLRVRGPNAPPTIAITTPSDGGSAPAGTAVSLAATATDDFDGNLGSRVHWTSSKDGALGTGATLSARLSEGAHTLKAAVADSDGAGTSAAVSFTVTPTPPVIRITAPANGTVVFAGPVTFTGSATDATDGDLSAGLAWRSDLDGPIGTGPTFATSTLRVGTHLVTAAVTDAGGLRGEAQATVVVRPPNASPTLTINSPTGGDSLLTGKPVRLAATATDAENGDLGARIRWTSSRDGLLGTGATLSPTTLSAGTHVLTASVTDLDGAPASASVTVRVSPSTVAFVPVADTYVDASKATTKFGTSTTLWADNSPVKQALFRFTVAGVAPFAVEKAILRLTAGSTSASASKMAGIVRSFTDNGWSEATTTWNAGRPTLDGPVLAALTTAVKANQVIDFDVTGGVAADGTYDFAVITSSSDEVIYQSRESAKKPQLLLTLKRNTPPAIVITAPADGTSVQVGAPVTLTAVATDAENGNLHGNVDWFSSQDGHLGPDATLVVPALSPGVHTITARVTDLSGASAEASITLNVSRPPAVAITAPASGAIVFTTDLPATFRGTATDPEDGDLTGRLAWTSSLDGPLGTGGSVAPATLRIGTHTIRAAVADNLGIPGEAAISIRVRGPNVAPHVTIAAPVDGGSVPAGTPVGLTASASDDFDGDLSARIAWTSDIDGPLFTGASQTRVLHEGRHTLTAAVTDSDGASGRAAVTFTVAPTPPVVSISAPASGAAVFAGNPLMFTGSASDATDGDLSAGLQWTSDLDGPIGSGASFTTSALRQGTHTVTARASDAGGLPGEARRTVVVRPPDALPTITIDAPASGAAVLTGRPVLLTATALDAEDGNLSETIRWTSSRDGLLGTGAMLSVSTLSAGTHALTARVVDRDGAEASASTTITVYPATMMLSADADTYVDAANPSNNFGAATALWADGSPVKETFLRFTVGSLGPFGVRQALLRLTAAGTTAAASAAGGVVHSISDGTWSETATTFDTAHPAIDGPTLATQGAVKSNQVVDFDVTAGIAGAGTYNLAVVTTSSDEVVYQSREAATGRPQLIVVLQSPDEPRVTIQTPVTATVVSLGQALAFGGTASDPQDGDLSAALHWSSTLDGAIGTGASFSRILSAGTHTITASVADTAMNMGSASVVVTVQSGGNVGFRDFTYPSAVGTQTSNEATAQKPESHLWYLDGTWWATLYRQSAGAHRIHRLDRATQQWIDTGVSLDSRPTSRQDVLWNGAKLYMADRAGYTEFSSQNKLLRYTYDAGLKTYFLDAGFPVDLPGAGTESLTLAEDTTGTFWVAYTLNNQIMVAHSVGDDKHWGTPFVIPVALGTTVDADDIGGVIALPGKIGVFWTNQATQADYFAFHVNGAPDGAWTEEVAVSGSKAADDHFNMKLASDGRLFVGMKTSRTGASDILVGLLVRSPSGTWSPMYNVMTFDTLATRPYVALDELHRRVYVFFSPFHESIAFKSSDMDSIAFPSGLGTPFIASSSVKDINNPTGTKQNVTADGGIEVIASSSGDLSYWHNGFTP